MYPGTVQTEIVRVHEANFGVYGARRSGERCSEVHRVIDRRRGASVQPIDEPSPRLARA